MRRFMRTLGLVAAALIGLAFLVQSAIPAASGQADGGLGSDAQRGGGGTLHLAGASFVPESSSTVYQADVDGGVSVTGSGDRYVHAPVLLPDGARISGLTFTFYDALSPDAMTARLFRNNDPHPGSRQTMASASSPAGGTGYGSAYGSVGADPMSIDNARYNYEIEVYWTAGSAGLRLMSVKVHYTNP